MLQELACWHIAPAHRSAHRSMTFSSDVSPPPTQSSWSSERKRRPSSPHPSLLLGPSLHAPGSASFQADCVCSRRESPHPASMSVLTILQQSNCSMSVYFFQTETVKLFLTPSMGYLQPSLSCSKPSQAFYKLSDSDTPNFSVDFRFSDAPVLTYETSNT